MKVSFTLLALMIGLTANVQNQQPEQGYCNGGGDSQLMLNIGQNIFTSPMYAVAMQEIKKVESEPVAELLAARGRSYYVQFQAHTIKFNLDRHLNLKNFEIQKRDLPSQLDWIYGLQPKKTAGALQSALLLHEDFAKILTQGKEPATAGGLRTYRVVALNSRYPSNEPYVCLMISREGNRPGKGKPQRLDFIQVAGLVSADGQRIEKVCVRPPTVTGKYLEDALAQPNVQYMLKEFDHLGLTCD